MEEVTREMTACSTAFQLQRTDRAPIGKLPSAEPAAPGNPEPPAPGLARLPQSSQFRELLLPVDIVYDVLEFHHLIGGGETDSKANDRRTVESELRLFGIERIDKEQPLVRRTCFASCRATRTVS